MERFKRFLGISGTSITPPVSEESKMQRPHLEVDLNQRIIKMGEKIMQFPDNPEWELLLLLFKAPPNTAFASRQLLDALFQGIENRRIDKRTTGWTSVDVPQHVRLINATFMRTFDVSPIQMTGRNSGVKYALEADVKTIEDRIKNSAIATEPIWIEQQVPAERRSQIPSAPVPAATTRETPRMIRTGERVLAEKRVQVPSVNGLSVTESSILDQLVEKGNYQLLIVLKNLFLTLMRNYRKQDIILQL